MTNSAIISQIFVDRIADSRLWLPLIALPVKTLPLKRTEIAGEGFVMLLRQNHLRSALFAASAVGALSASTMALGQVTPQPPAAQEDDVADIVVTGIRGSLQSATNAKKNAMPLQKGAVRRGVR